MSLGVWVQFGFWFGGGVGVGTGIGSGWSGGTDLTLPHLPSPPHPHLPLSHLSPPPLLSLLTFLSISRLGRHGMRGTYLLKMIINRRKSLGGDSIQRNDDHLEYSPEPTLYTPARTTHAPISRLRHATPGDAVIKGKLIYEARPSNISRGKQSRCLQNGQTG